MVVSDLRVKLEVGRAVLVEFWIGRKYIYYMFELEASLW